MIQIFRDTNINNHYILRDNQGHVLCYIESENDISNITMQDIVSALENPYICPKYRVSILNPDETVNYEIPFEDIPQGGISFNETYQNGQRKSLTLKLINKDGKYTPCVNKGNKYYKYNDTKQKIKNEEVFRTLIWKNTKFKYDLGIVVKDNTLWFSKGIYVLSTVDVDQEDSLKEVTLQLKDKYSIFEDATGKLLTTYEIKVDNLARKVIQDLLNTDFGNGYSLDTKQFIMDSSLYNFKIQADIKKEAGDTVGSILSDIATQMSAEIYYDDEGHLLFIPIDETLNDENKNICWKYTVNNNDLINLRSNYDFEKAINMIKVVGDNVDNGIFSALVVNTDPRSPICVGQIGKCLDDPITDANIWSNQLARDLGRYNLRKKSLVPLSLSATVKINPLVIVDSLCEIEHKFFNFKREKCVINSISYTDSTGQMDLSITNIQNLQFTKTGDGGYEL